MPDEPVTVAVGGLEITSSHETAEEMVKALTPADKDESKQPRVIKPIPDKPKAEESGKSPLSKAASELGRKGGEAAAKARKEAAKEAVAAQEPEPEEGVEGESEEKPLGKPRDDPRARMLEATRKEAEAKRERDFYRAEYERLRAESEVRRGQPEPRQEAQQPAKERPPFKWEDFDTPEDYTAAYFEWATQRQQERALRDTEINAYASKIDTAISTYNEKLWQALGVDSEEAADQAMAQALSEDVRGLRPSFVLREGERITAETVIADEIVGSADPYGVMLYLSKHPDVFQRLATLPSYQQVQREMAKVEARVEDASHGTPSPQRATSSKAHPPVRPVTGAPVSADLSEVSDELPFEEWVKRRKAQDSRNGRR